jgi:hypothetical protein
MKIIAVIGSRRLFRDSFLESYRDEKPLVRNNGEAFEVRGIRFIVLSGMMPKENAVAGQRSQFASPSSPAFPHKALFQNYHLP